MAVPEEIKKLKPTNLGKVEIRHISNGYYVYSYSSYYSKEKKRSVKRTGKMLGKITLEDGFIPSKKYAVLPRSYSVKVYGVYNLFEQTNKELIERLRKYYPHLYKEIFTIASLRLVHNCTNASMKEFYDNSSLSITQPKLALSKNSMTRIYEKLGSSRGNMVDFMREYVNDDTTILFDGTNIFTQSSKASYAQKGYNHGKRKSTQVNLLYMFALKATSKNKPHAPHSLKFPSLKKS